jgi:hypothetical protein
MPSILAAAISTRTTSVALFAAGAELRLERSATAANDEFASPRPLLRRFLAQDLGSLAAACVSAAVTPPTSWPPLAAADLAAALGMADVELIDEVVAGGEWLLGLAPEEIEPLPATGALPGAAGEGFWAVWDGGAAAPRLARLRRGAGGGVLEAGPLAPASRSALAAPAAGAASSGTSASPAAALGGLIAAVAALAPHGAAAPEAGFGLYLGGAGIGTLTPTDRRQLAEAFANGGQARIPVHLVQRPPSPLWGAARRAWRLLR